MSLDVWHTGSSGLLTSETSSHRLEVKRYNHSVRYLVYQKPNDKVGPSSLVGSGFEGSVREAMKKAVSVAERLSSNASSATQFAAAD